MEHALVIFASLSHMNRVKRSFRAEGRYFDGVRTPKCLAGQGCSHAIRCPPGETAEITQRAMTIGVAWRGVYLAHEGSEGMRYLPLDAAVHEGSEPQ